MEAGAILLFSLFIFLRTYSSEKTHQSSRNSGQSKTGRQAGSCCEQTDRHSDQIDRQGGDRKTERHTKTRAEELSGSVTKENFKRKRFEKKTIRELCTKELV